MTKRVLDPSGVGEAVKHGLSPWFIKLSMEDESDTPLGERQWPEANRPLSPLSAKMGNEFEKKIYEYVEPHARKVVDEWKDYDKQEENREKIQELIKEVGGMETGEFILLEQARLLGEIGSFRLAGDSDLIILWSTEKGVHIRIFDIKSSWEEKTHQQVQTAVYSILFERLMEDIDYYELSTGIITHNSDLEDMTPEGLPSFERDTREDDVKRMLREDGPFMKAFNTDLEDIPLDIVNESQSSKYGEIYVIKGIEERSLGLVGLSRGEQRTLKSYGITDIEDLAEVIEPLDNPRPYKFEDPEIRSEWRDTIQEIEENHGFGERLPLLAQRSQSFLGVINPNHKDAHTDNYSPWLQGVGSANLPEDEPMYDSDELEIEEGSLIRVYMNVQYDYIRDCLHTISARVTSTNHSGNPLTVSESCEQIEKGWEFEGEDDMLESFTDDLFNAIRTVGALTGRQKKAPVHFYFFTEDENEKLVEALDRSSGPSILQSFRDLLGMREGIDQAMVSIIKPEIESRIARKHPNVGILPAWDELSPYDESERMEYDDWTYERENGEEINLRDAFNVNLFDYKRPYVSEGDGISVELEGGVNADGFYPCLPRTDAQIPLEYVWASIGPFDESWLDTAQTKSLIEHYKWVDKNNKEERITREDIEEMSNKFSQALEHIERSLEYRDASITKKDIKISELDSFTLGESNLSRACREYLDLEYHKNKVENLQRFQLPVKKRILEGESAPFRVKSTENFGYMLRIEGELIYDYFTFDNPDQIAASSRIGGSDGVSSGSWLVATPLKLTPDGYETDINYPEDIEHSTPMSVKEFDPSDNTIVLESYRRGRKPGETPYTSWYRGWTQSEEEAEESSNVLFKEGEEFILDPQVDDANSNKSIVALEKANSNPIYNQINNIRDNKTRSLPRDPVEMDGVNEWIEWANDNLDISPNEKQRDFIKQIESKVSLLQGPPGTGKTSGAVSHIVLAKTLGYSINDSQFKGLVTGASNKAVDELLEDVSDLLSEYDKGELDNVRLVRLVLGDPPSDAKENVEYLDYNETGEVDNIKSVLTDEQQTLSDVGGETEHVIVFGTPSRIQSFIDKLETNNDVYDIYQDKSTTFDMLAVDEASMLPIHQLLMCSAFIDEENGHTILAGDHRQMPPVQGYEWSDETRRIITENLPYLSSLDYFRFLRGENVRRVPDDVDQPEANIPMTRLERTYRCNTAVAKFLHRWMYSQDGIDYKSNIEDKIPEIKTGNEGIDSILNKDSPITLVMHEDSSSRQSNYHEALIAKSLIENIPDSESVGVVTPHNSQKGLLTSMCKSEALIDTVERFQGGERDVMILSATVSDPDYLDKESEFILNPNRLNVALSRMKKKLVVIAPKTLFEMIPTDVDEYNDSVIWKGLYSSLNAGGDPVWDGSVDDISEGNSSVDIELYENR